MLADVNLDLDARVQLSGRPAPSLSQGAVRPVFGAGFLRSASELLSLFITLSANSVRSSVY